jgi:hypothetical protein
MKVKIYQTKEGRKPYKEWFLLLKDKQTSLRIDARLGRLRNGNLAKRIEIDPEHLYNALDVLIISKGNTDESYSSHSDQTTF